MRGLFIALICLTVTGCSFGFMRQKEPDVRSHMANCAADQASCLPFTIATSETMRPMPRSGEKVLGASLVAGKSVDDVDGSSAAERAQAADNSKAGGTALGTTIAALGDVTEQGFWIRTPLVKSEMKGRVEWVATKASVTVTLLPLDAEVGAGSQISLSALRALNAPLTDLLELRVFKVAS